jgi:uncharacterized membrane protein YeaQ/YmgE (transglycosylase-associated protein family)
VAGRLIARPHRFFLAPAWPQWRIHVRLFWRLIIGADAGGMARLLAPEKQPLGLLRTIGLSLLGSVIGGGVHSMIYGYRRRHPGYHMAGVGMSIVGSVLVAAIFVALSRRSLRQ